MYTMQPDFKSLLNRYLPKMKLYPFNEFTMDVDKEKIKKDIEDLKKLDEWVERSLRVSDDFWYWRATI